MPAENILDLRPKQTKHPKDHPQRSAGWLWFKKNKVEGSEKIELPKKSHKKRTSKPIELKVHKVEQIEKEEIVQDEPEEILLNFIAPEEEPVILESETPESETPAPDTILSKEVEVAESDEEKEKGEPKKHPADDDLRHFRRLSPKQAIVAVSVFTLLGLAALAPTGMTKVVDTAKAMQGGVMNLATSGFNSFNSAQAAITNQDFEQAATEFESAELQFSQARAELNSLSYGLVAASQYLPGQGSKPATVDNLLVIGQHVAAAGNSMSESATLISSLDISALRQDESVGLTSVLVALHATLRQAQDHLSIATLASEDVDVTDLPVDVQQQVNELLANLPGAQTSMDELVQAVEVALGVLGHDQPRRYIVLFQNNRELRATGGFLGSFAMIDVDKGVVKKITIPGGGIYDLAGQVAEKIQAPKPLQLVNPYWNIQDANWWPDFPTSAQKVEWFWGKAGGPTVDGVLTLTPTVIEDLLSLTGPIDLTETYGVVITADNFYQTVQLQAEAKFDETNQSKKILADLTPILFNQLFNLEGKELIAAMGVLQQSLDQKEILLYSDDPILQREIVAAGWAGEMKEVEGDYLQVVDTNIGGGKTDGVIDETISHHVKMDAHGNLIVTVQVTRNHRGNPSDPLNGVNNWDYMRIYVPKGSEFISAQGFVEPDATKIQPPAAGTIIDADYVAISGDVLKDEQTGMRISTEFGKTLFANWVETKPGQSTSVTISYKLPFQLKPDGGWFDESDYYSLFIQKQPGSFDPYVALSMDLPDGVKVLDSDPVGAAASVGFVLNQDQLIQVELANR